MLISAYESVPVVPLAADQESSVKNWYDSFPNGKNNSWNTVPVVVLEERSVY